LTVLGVGVLIHRLRCTQRGKYGFIETVVGALTVWFALNKIFTPEPATPAPPDHWIDVIALLGGLYVVVRGLDNCENGLKGRASKMYLVWKALFHCNWLRRKSRQEGWKELKEALIDTL
jgi:hypothetical protein